MNYELAKELKDAGFPAGQNDNFAYDVAYLKTAPIVAMHGIYAPVLSELIEACGAHFDSLQKWGSFNRYTATDQKWCAFAYERNVFASGETPEEAVARLWLALNKK